MKAKYIIIIIVAALLVLLGCPFLINCIIGLKPIFNMNVIGDNESWLGFYGSYIGSIIGSVFSVVIAIVVIYIEKRNQISARQYEESLRLFEKFIDDYQKMYSFMNSILIKLSQISELLKVEDFDKITECLYEVNKQQNEFTGFQNCFLANSFLYRRILDNAIMESYMSIYRSMQSAMHELMDITFESALKRKLGSTHMDVLEVFRLNIDKYNKTGYALINHLNTTITIDKL